MLVMPAQAWLSLGAGSQVHAQWVDYFDRMIKQIRIHRSCICRCSIFQLTQWNQSSLGWDFSFLPLLMPVEVEPSQEVVADFPSSIAWAVDRMFLFATFMILTYFAANSALNFICFSDSGWPCFSCQYWSWYRWLPVYTEQRSSLLLVLAISTPTSTPISLSPWSSCWCERSVHHSRLWWSWLSFLWLCLWHISAMALIRPPAAITAPVYYSEYSHPHYQNTTRNWYFVAQTHQTNCSTTLLPRASVRYRAPSYSLHSPSSEKLTTWSWNC